MKPANHYQILTGLFQNHVDGCRKCQQAKWTGFYCEEGHKLNDEVIKFYNEVARERRVA